MTHRLVAVGDRQGTTQINEQYTSWTEVYQSGRLLGSGVLPPGGHITRALLTQNAHTNLVKDESTHKLIKTHTGDTTTTRGGRVDYLALGTQHRQQNIETKQKQPTKVDTNKQKSTKQQTDTQTNTHTSSSSTC